MTEYFTGHPHIDNNCFKLVYKDNIALKIAFATLETSDAKVNKYSDISIKHLSNEYKSLNKINDIVLSELKKDPNFTIRTPIACFLEYSGVVAIALGLPKI